MLLPRPLKALIVLIPTSIAIFIFSSLPLRLPQPWIITPDPLTSSPLVPCAWPSTELTIPNLTLPSLQQHRYRTDGLLEVNEKGPHPIYELIANAQAAWESKLKSSSRNLPEAVREYKRRYHRAPPRGFDLWWNYVAEHDVQLPDEYDSIFHDLEPFWGMEPLELITARDELESEKDSYTLGQTNDTGIGVVKYAFREGTYKHLIHTSEGFIDLLQDVEEFLPPFRAVMNPHDNPAFLSDYNIKSALLEAAVNRSHIARSELPKIDPIGWVAACGPSSPARLEPLNLDVTPPESSQKTFIHDHKLSMDPCFHPTLFHHHGQFLAHNLGPNPPPAMVPLFSLSPTTLHYDIRVPSAYGWVDDTGPRKEWNDRPDERLLWRGSNTGIYHSEWTRWRNSHREFLVRFANEVEGTRKVLRSTGSRFERVGKAREVRKARLNPAMMDVAFSGKPIGCEEATCTLLEEMFSWRKYQTFEEAGSYKYVFDVDGNGWSSRFQRLITSNSLVFKATIYPEWYMDRIAPWVHYVPIQVDLSDLHDALNFFRGDGNGDDAHEHLAHKIAVAGRQWSKTFWRREDIVAYLFRLMLEYSRIMSLDREAMSYVESQT